MKHTESCRMLRGAWEAYSEYIHKLRTEPYPCSRLRRRITVIRSEYCRILHEADNANYQRTKVVTRDIIVSSFSKDGTFLLPKMRREAPMEISFRYYH